MSLSGKLAVVTGGASGIGRAVCQVLSSSGVNCVVADLNLEDAKKTQAELAKESLQHCAVQVDVSSWDSVDSLFKQVRDKYKKPATVVVNCAGITRDGFLLDMTERQFDQVINVNLKGTFMMTKFAAQEMVADKVDSGSIINISSIIGKTGNIGQTNYAASKAGVVGFTKSAAQELAKFKIRCNAVMPGFIDTPMVATVPEKLMVALIQGIPMKRKGTAEEVAEVVKFLASEDSSYMTGTVMEVTGGLFM